METGPKPEAAKRRRFGQHPKCERLGLFRLKPAFDRKCGRAAFDRQCRHPTFDWQRRGTSLDPKRKPAALGWVCRRRAFDWQPAQCLAEQPFLGERFWRIEQWLLSS
jgi:hypothetical protein